MEHLGSRFFKCSSRKDASIRARSTSTQNASMSGLVVVHHASDTLTTCSSHRYRVHGMRSMIASRGLKEGVHPTSTVSVTGPYSYRSLVAPSACVVRMRRISP